jgi:hypothetical protein
VSAHVQVGGRMVHFGSPSMLMIVRRQKDASSCECKTDPEGKAGNKS